LIGICVYFVLRNIFDKIINRKQYQQLKQNENKVEGTQSKSDEIETSKDIKIVNKNKFSSLESIAMASLKPKV